MKDELGKGHKSEFVAIAPKVYAYQQIHIDNTLSVDKKLQVLINRLLKRV